MLLHQLNSVNNSSNMSGLTSAKNSNRPSKASANEVERTLSHGVSDSIFEKASLILQQYNSELPPRPHVTFCNPKSTNNSENKH